MNTIQINTSCILNVPLQIYNEDFTFIVNGKEFQTSRLISDLLSPKICQIHKSDPTNDMFILNTQHEGDFLNLLKIFNFNLNTIPEREVPFILEVIEILGNKSILLQEQNQPEEINCENVFTLIFKHLKYPSFYSEKISKEIDFISCHFFELFDKYNEEMKKFDINTLHRIISNKNLRLTDEDQLLQFINSIYQNDHEYSILYEAVIFKNVSPSMMKEFDHIIDHYDINIMTWSRLCERLEVDLKTDINNDRNQSRYTNKKHLGQIFSPSEQNEFSGIISHLTKQSGNNIEKLISITSSSVYGNYGPINTVLYDNKESFLSNVENAWICFDFKENRIIPTDYTIRSTNYGEKNNYHPKSWVIEVSNDNKEWEVVDTQTNCQYLNDQFIVHTFKIEKQPKDEVRYIKLRQTDKNWRNDNFLAIDSIEIYGQLI